MITRLSSEEARRLLEAGRVGRLGCVYEGAPYVVPVNYVTDGENVLIHSLSGRKIEALRANPRACLQVDEVDDPCHWRSVIAFGTFEELSDSRERDGAAERLVSRFPGLTPVESVPVHDGQSSVIIFRIRIREVTGVAEK